MGRLHSILPCQPVDTIRGAQRGFLQPERVIQLRKPIALVLHELDLVAVLDGLEMLPGVSHDQQEKAAQCDTELSHLAAAPGVFDFYQARIVNRLGEVDLGSSSPARLTPPAADCALNHCRGRHYATPASCVSCCASSD